MSRNSTRCAGFTLVELLVVIAIIGLLTALLLPAVQAARESARRASCTNNMKQIGIALHNYHDAHKTFPPMVVLGGNSLAIPRPAYHHTWLTKILPFLEQRSIYDLMDARLPAWDAANNAPMPHMISAVGINSDWCGATSLHPGLANALMADGSVRSFSDTMDFGLWVKLNGRHDGCMLSGY